MADTWFRFYNDAVIDPKVQRLSGDMFKMWVNILCLASKFGGALPKDDLQYSLRLSETEAQQTIAFFIERNLLDDLGDIVTPHNWDGRQYKSDQTDPTNAERQKRYRNGKRNAPVTDDRNGSNAVTVTATEQNRTESDTDTEQKEKERSPADAGAEVVEFTGGPYAFHGKLVRLKQDQLDKWRIAFPALTDIRDEIALADEYYAEHPPNDGKWFFKVYAWLNKANKEAATKRKQHLRAIGDAW
jgi:hypothetical protein